MIDTQRKDLQDTSGAKGKSNITSGLFVLPMVQRPLERICSANEKQQLYLQHSGLFCCSWCRKTLFKPPPSENITTVRSQGAVSDETGRAGWSTRPQRPAEQGK